jgi:hypothetical protein
VKPKWLSSFGEENKYLVVSLMGKCLEIIMVIIYNYGELVEEIGRRAEFDIDCLKLNRCFKY